MHWSAINTSVMFLSICLKDQGRLAANKSMICLLCISHACTHCKHIPQYDLHAQMLLVALCLTNVSSFNSFPSFPALPAQLLLMLLSKALSR